MTTVLSLRRSARWGLALCLLAGSLGAYAATNLVRITPEQYRRTIDDVFGPTIEYPENTVAPGFRDDGLLALGTRKLTITSSEFERYEMLAQTIAAQVADPKRRSTFVHCAPKSETGPDDDCAASFIERVGLHLFRRPLTDEELVAYVETQRAAAEQRKSFDAGLATALAALLVSPEFLFRVERSAPGAGEGAAESLDAWSRASRLSFFLWNTTPDAELLEAARSGALSTPAGLDRQVERLLASPRLEYGVRAFFSDMLGFDAFATLGIDAALYPRFTKTVHEDAQEQTLRTIVDHLIVRNRDYRDLFVTRDTFLTPSLAALYGVPLARSQELGGAVPWVAYRFRENDPRVGLLSHVSFLSLNSHPGTSSPTLRGKALREKLLCQRVPPPPGNVDFSIVQNTDDPRFKTTRQRLTAHRKDAMCAGCHKVTDPIGLSLEHFDTASQFRTMENGAPIDVSGELNGRSFDGLAELAAIIRDDPAAATCIVQRAYSYGTQRKPSPAERDWLKALPAELAQGPGLRWRELMGRIVRNPQFYAVPVAEAETLTTQNH